MSPFCSSVSGGFSLLPPDLWSLVILAGMIDCKCYKCNERASSRVCSRLCLSLAEKTPVSVVGRKERNTAVYDHNPMLPKKKNMLCNYQQKP